jgi:hypothetical protein
MSDWKMSDCESDRECRIRTAELERERNGRIAFEETIDNVRKALGMESTHYLVIADDVKLLKQQFDSLRIHGCVTGDCLHYDVRDCGMALIKAIIEAYSTVMKRLSDNPEPAPMCSNITGDWPERGE